MTAGVHSAQKLLLFNMLCCVAMNVATLCRAVIAVRHFLSTVTQVSLRRSSAFYMR